MDRILLKGNCRNYSWNIIIDYTINHIGENLSYNLNPNKNVLRRMSPIIDYMYSKNLMPEEMDAALLYPKQSVMIHNIVMRMRNIMTSPEMMNVDKEMFFLSSYCNEKMIGQSSNLFYRWYDSTIKFCNYKLGKNNILFENILYEFDSIFDSLIMFVGPYMDFLFEQMLDIYVTELKLTGNKENIVKIYKMTKQYFSVGTFDFYTIMTQMNFSTSELNPTLYLCELWEEYHNVENIAYSIHLGILETQKELQKHRDLLHLNEETSYMLDYDWETELEQRAWEELNDY